MTTTIRRNTVRLKFTDGEVLVTPRDMDAFVMSANRATEACKEAAREAGRIKQFQEEFLVPVHDWCVRHSRHVRSCYVPVPTSGISVYVVTRDKRFDFGLADETAQLEAILQRSGWPAAVSQLPATDEDSIGTFFSPDGALEVYAQSE